MYVFDLATVNAPKDDRAMLEVAHTRSVAHQRPRYDGGTMLVDERDEPIMETYYVETCDISWPLENAKVVHNGNIATVSIPRPGQGHLRVDQLVDVKMTGQQQDSGPITMVGRSSILTDAGFDEKEATITFVVESYKVCQTQNR